MSQRFRDRPMADIIVFMFAVAITFVIIIFVVTICVVEFVNPDAEISSAAASVRDLTSTLIAGVIGYLGGRRVTDKSDKENSETPLE